MGSLRIVGVPDHVPNRLGPTLLLDNSRETRAKRSNPDGFVGCVEKFFVLFCEKLPNVRKWGSHIGDSQWSVASGFPRSISKNKQKWILKIILKDLQSVPPKLTS